MTRFFYALAALLFAMGALASIAAAIGFIRVRIWWGALFLMLLALMLTGAVMTFARNALV